MNIHSQVGQRLTECHNSAYLESHGIVRVRIEVLAQMLHVVIDLIVFTVTAPFSFKFVEDRIFEILQHGISLKLCLGEAQIGVDLTDASTVTSALFGHLVGSLIVKRGKHLIILLSHLRFILFFWSVASLLLVNEFKAFE